MDFQFDKQDFDKLMFPVHTMPDNVDPVKHFERLSKWEEFYANSPVNKKNKIFKWVVYMYDKESPFRNLVVDSLKRKIEIAKYVHLIDDPKNLEKFVQKMLQGQNKIVNRMIIAYVRMQRDSKYALTVGLDNLFYKDLTTAMEGGTPKKSLATTQKELEESVIELLNQDNNPHLSRDLYEYMEEERVSTFRPEGIAEALAAGEDPFKDEEISYGDNDD